MRLSSKQHDYYDGHFRYNGSDKKSVFVRNKRLLPDDVVVARLLSNIPRSDNLDKPVATVSYGVIGFCGSMYPFVKVSRHTVVNGETKPVNTYFYNFEHMLANMPDLFREIEYKGRIYVSHDLFEKCKKYLTHGMSIIYEFDKGLLACNIKEDKQLSNLFLNERIAYFVIEYGKRTTMDGRDVLDIIAYPILKDYGFFKVFDTFAAFQQIEMFLQNQIVKPDDPYIADVPDVITAESHGFNKESFRQERTTKKPRLH